MSAPRHDLFSSMHADGQPTAREVSVRVLRMSTAGPASGSPKLDATWSDDSGGRAPAPHFVGCQLGTCPHARFKLACTPTVRIITPPLARPGRTMGLGLALALSANLKVGSACGGLDKLPLHWPLAQCSVGPGPLAPRLALAAPRPKTAGARGRAEPGQRRARGASQGPYRPLAGARLQLACGLGVCVYISILLG